MVGDGARNPARALARRQGDRRLDPHHRGARAALARAAALPARRVGPPARPRAIFPAFRAFYRFRHGINAATVEAGRTKMAAALDRIAAELRPSGYLAGDTFSVADLTAAALFAPLVIPPELQYRLPDPLPSVLVGYRSALGGHPAYRWVTDVYRRHRGVSAEVAA
ncbi:MAG: hypothetical protein E6J69_03170 [Deltaproteobacteria bacterium]|nr:MAG: hypothetical protein E6J69_03170 [Deltaproteobacteria bacterium]